MKEKAKELLKNLLLLRPGAVKVIVPGVSGEQVEVAVPVDENGLPKAREILRGSSESIRGAKIKRNEIEKAKVLGLFSVPEIIGGVVRETQGILMVLANGNFVFSTDKAVTVPSATGKKGEVETRYFPLHRIPAETPLFALEVAKERDLKGIWGQIIALQFDLKVVE